MDRDRQKHDGAPLSVRSSGSERTFKLGSGLVTLSLVSVGFVASVFFVLSLVSALQTEVTTLRDEVRSVSESTARQLDTEVQWFKLGEIDSSGALVKKNIFNNNSISGIVQEMLQKKSDVIEFENSVRVTVSTTLNVRSAPEVSDNRLPIQLYRGNGAFVVEIRIVDSWVWARSAPSQG